MADRSNVDAGSLRLVVLALKERRGGQPIAKLVIIDPHPDPLICPVSAFSEYISRFPTPLPVSSHPTRPDFSLIPLIRSVRGPHLLSAQRISRRIRDISSLISLPTALLLLAVALWALTLPLATGLPGKMSLPKHSGLTQTSSITIIGHLGARALISRSWHSVLCLINQIENSTKYNVVWS